MAEEPPAPGEKSGEKSDKKIDEKTDKKSGEKTDEKTGKKTDENAPNNRFCFLTLCLHLNKKFEDEWSLYENIASQLSVYSDFEETEVDDRDEDEEEDKKTAEELLADLKKNIIKEIERRELTAATKVKKPVELAAGKPKELPKKIDEEAEKKAKEDGYLLLILDDEGSMTKEDVVMNDLKLKNFLTEILDGEGSMTKEDVVMKLENSHKDVLKDPNRLKILVTRRKEDKELTKTEEETNTKENGSHSGEDEGKNDKDSASDVGTKSQEITEEGNVPPATEEAQVPAHDVKSASTTGDKLLAAKKISDEIDLSKDLLDTINESSLRDLFLSIVTKEWKSDEELISHMVKKSKNLPAAIVVLANSLKQITGITSDPGKDEETKEKGLRERELIEKMRKLKKTILEVLSADRFAPSESGSSSESRGEKNVPLADRVAPSESSSSSESQGEKKVLPADRPAPSDQGSTAESAINPILHLAYKLLETYGPLKDAILDCFWHSLDFFEHCGCVYYRDLITQWILEGYFDPVKSVEKAYQDGHNILMELINRGMLKIQENNVVVPERAMSSLIDPRRRGHLGRSQLGFSRVYAGDKKKGIGKITQLDDMIKTVQAKKGDKISTILVSGDRLRRETPEKYFKKLGDLEVLGLFEPTLEPFVPAFSKLHKLWVLVIRDCDLLTDIEELKALRELNALEVSGASSLKKISDDFFKALSKLQSLHLSGLRITSSPSSISELTELHCLIIRDCPLLEDLPDIQELVKLEVVDISGARGLQTCFDNTKGEKKNKSKNKNFYHLRKLQLLDFSESQIERLPIFQDSAVADKLHSLKRLLLRNCSKLRRLPSLKPLSGLQILDLSGTTSLVEMLEVCFEDKKELKTLNLTGTNLSELATTIEDLSNLNELLLKNCTNLEALPDITKLTNLEVIDVSGCTKLQKIEGSFEEMSYLRVVNLSGTKVQTPKLPKERKIHGLKLFIRADGTCFEGKGWNEVKESLPSEVPEIASSSTEIVKSQETVEKEPEEIGDIQPNEPRTNEFTEKKDVSKERLLQVPVGSSIYKMALPLFDFASQQEAMKIHASKYLGGESLANADFVSFVDISSTRLTSIFNETTTVKSCWLRMCMDVKDLFSAVEEQRLGLLETLLITNLPSLNSISRGGSFQNLKKLSIDCCPNIITLFPEESQLPSSLEVLHIKYCEKLEKVFKEEGEVSTLTTLCLVGLPVLSAVGAKLPNLETFEKRNCPKLPAEIEDLKGSAS